MRVRFAPSPTGNLHIGSVRTALFNWLFAKHHKATFIVRIEDTDGMRSEEQFEHNILEGLEWLGIDFDEGPGKDGPYAPYRQSERMAQKIYDPFAEQLIQNGHAYRCFCTGEMLEAERNAALAANVAYQYSRRCLHLSDAEIQDHLTKNTPHTVRIKVPNKIVAFDDLIRGNIQFDLNLLSDFILIKSDGSPSYNFAVVVDDILMKITHIIRGEDHISNTPKQLIIFEAFGASIPYFAHIPMILGPDRSKLSKRHGATAVTQYQTEGYLPKALLNYLSLLGWSPPEGKEVMSLDEIVSLFSLDKVSKSGAIFDVVKLKWMNGQYIRQLSNEDLYEKANPFMSDSIQTKLLEHYSSTEITAIFGLIKESLSTLVDINEQLEMFVRSAKDIQVKLTSNPLDTEQQNIIAAFKIALSDAAPTEPAQFKTVATELAAKLSLPAGKIFKSIRLACTGDGSGPDLMAVLSLIGKDRLLARL